MDRKYDAQQAAFSEGARYERKALLAKVRREIRRKRDSTKKDPPTVFNPLVLVMLEEWILERRKRYESKSGGLGRKKR